MPQAYEDLESIYEYIARDSLYYASSFLERLLETGESLSSFFNRGTRLQWKSNRNIREIYIKEFRLIYEITQN